MRTPSTIIWVAAITVGFVCAAVQGEEISLLPTANAANAGSPCGLTDIAPLPTPLTSIRFMPSRYKDLEETLEGNRLTNVPLVSYGIDGYRPAGFGDDLGIYYFVPLIGRVLHQDLARSISTFLLGGFGFCFGLGTIGWLLFMKTSASRVIALAGVSLLATVAYHLGDIYLFEGGIPVLLFPWFLQLVRKSDYSRALMLFLAGAGVILGTVFLVRTDAALPSLCFLIIAIVYYLQTTTKRKLALVLAVSLGVSVPWTLFEPVIKQRDRFLMQEAGLHSDDLRRHTFWHLAYFGLGYVNIPGLPAGACDQVSKFKVLSIAPKAVYLGAEYDHILRSEVLQVIRAYPGAAALSALAKIGTTLAVVLAFSNVGMLAAVVYPKNKALDLSLLGAVVISALPFFIVTPSWQYLVGVISLSSIYGLISIHHGLLARQLELKQLGQEMSLQTQREYDLEVHST